MLQFTTIAESGFINSFINEIYDITIKYFNLQDDDFKRTIDESTRMERNYDKYFDVTIINNDLNDTYDAIMEAIDRLATEPQWVPVTWVY